MADISDGIKESRLILNGWCVSNDRNYRLSFLYDKEQKCYFYALEVDSDSSIKGFFDLKTTGYNLIDCFDKMFKKLKITC